MRIENMDIDAAIQLLLTKAYKAEWETIDGMNQHPKGWNYYKWLFEMQLISDDEFNRLQSIIDKQDF